MQAGAVVFFNLFDGQGFLAEARELNKLFLNLLQAFLPLTVGDLRLYSDLAAKTMPFVQSLNVGNLSPEARNLLSKDFQMIHRT